ncbi:aminopeptidase P [Moraxella macacae 0408225]|uniref:Xaa-Pro aminopeptidase n=1 Tax=Moraxella macacae 0408225 TaxID=1230338 RepID=L2FA47_9GAMM|nr:aminopeptidase P N-terminal domain-containing protein [Moraxella macacae]ELA09770.1 aminopeptidase P [Moraxella macacae 0408225]
MKINLLEKLPQSEFAKRRAKLAKNLPNNSLVILSTAPHHIRNNDAEYKYRPDSSFFYLTGFAEPESTLVLQKTANEVSYILFLREKDKLREIWDGRRVGIDGAIRKLGADKAFAIDELDEKIPQLLLGVKHLFARFDTRVSSWLAGAKNLVRGEGVVNEIHNIDSVIHEMRLIKDKPEIERIKTACQISSLAHIQAMKTVRPQQYEYQLEAELNYVFGQYGCVPSYNSIVASGDNANILHYIENDQIMQDGDLVMIDAGAEYQLYAGDISRTFPVNGKFSDVQKQVYNIVLKANIEAINSLKAGVHCKVHHDTALRILTQGLIELGILSGDVDTLIANKAYQPFYMHGTGHWLGLDVHDAGRYFSDETQDGEKQPRLLQAGMVMTVEPGLYFANDNELIPKKYRGIGIRIEDDVLITEHGAVVLTSDVPKTVEEIECLMADSIGNIDQQLAK